MKRVLIAGADSFVGTSVEEYLSKAPERYLVMTVDTRTDEWKDQDFSTFDVVYHVAGIAHSDVGQVTKEEKARYYRVNRDLAVEVAEKAKREGVGQFIFMSSAIVYGESSSIGKKKVITRDTPCSPANFYGDSKWQAEQKLTELGDQHFNVVILRCPMIYGRGGKGNFPQLERFALKLPLFPKIKNERSMLYIGNLTEFVRLMIDNEEHGVFWPCNAEYSNTSELIRMIAASRGKKCRLVPGFGWALKFLSLFTGIVNKAFGNLSYEQSLGEYKQPYRKYTLAESIEEMER